MLSLSRDPGRGSCYTLLNSPPGAGLPNQLLHKISNANLQANQLRECIQRIQELITGDPVLKFFICPVNQTLAQNPVIVAPCGHVISDKHVKPGALCRVLACNESLTRVFPGFRVEGLSESRMTELFSKKNNSEIPTESSGEALIECPISLCPIENPVITGCGHIFEKESLDKIGTGKECPFCRANNLVYQEIPFFKNFPLSATNTKEPQELCQKAVEIFVELQHGIPESLYLGLYDQFFSFIRYPEIQEQWLSHAFDYAIEKKKPIDRFNKDLLCVQFIQQLKNCGFSSALQDVHPVLRAMFGDPVDVAFFHLFKSVLEKQEKYPLWRLQSEALCESLFLKQVRNSINSAGDRKEKEAPLFLHQKVIESFVKLQKESGFKSLFLSLYYSFLCSIKDLDAQIKIIEYAVLCSSLSNESFDKNFFQKDLDKIRVIKNQKNWEQGWFCDLRNKICDFFHGP